MCKLFEIKMFYENIRQGFKKTQPCPFVYSSFCPVVSDLSTCNYTICPTEPEIFVI